MSGKVDPRVRRAELLRRAEAQREELTTQLQHFQPLFRGIDRGISAIGWLRRNRIGVAAGAGVAGLVVALARPLLARRAMNAGSRALQMGSTVATLLRTLKSLRSG
jgi:hypothetical protein